MKPRDAVVAQIQHRDSTCVPYSLSFEDPVKQRLDQHYGGPHWRSRLTPFIVGVGAVDTDPKVALDDKYVRDGYGGIWRQDVRPWHLEKPPLSEPTLDGYQFPVA